MAKIIRKSYTSKLGKVVPAKKITKQGLLKGRSSTRNKKSLEKVIKRSMMAKKRTGSLSRSRCSKGTILRVAYPRKSYTKKSGVKVKSTDVPASCIKDIGLEGKQKKTIVLGDDDHLLSEHGYHNIESLHP